MNCKKIVFASICCVIAHSSTGKTAASPEASGNEGNEISANDSSRIHNLDEIVVVSQPKESTLLRNQPLASNIFTGNETGKLGIREISDISAYVPAFQMPSYGSRLTSSLYIRGIGSRINNPAVGLYIDGIPLLTKSAYNFHIYQIDRIDILRGPQGTLYGMNTEGGLVRIYSKNPLSNNGTNIKIGWGNRFYRNLELSQYCRLSESTGISLSGFYNGTNGYLHNTTTGKRADSANEAGGRIRIVTQYSPRLTYDFIADYQYVNQAGFPYGELNTEDNSVQSPATNRDNLYKRNMLNSAFNIKYTLGNYALNSTTSYQFLSDRMNMDQDYTAADYMHLLQRQLQNGITQEFAVKGKSGKNWKHTTGLFGAYQWLRTEAPVYFDNDFTYNMATAIQSAMYGAMVESMSKKFMNMPGMTEETARAMAESTIQKAGGVSVSSLSMDVPGIFHTPQFNLGVFHESQVNITDDLTMTVGLRYDFSHVSVRYATSASMNLTANVMGVSATRKISSMLNCTHDNKFNQVLPKLGLLWRFSDNGSNVYAVVNKGYRSGGFNIQMFSDILQSELRANSSAAMRGDHDISHSQEDYEKIKSTISYKPEFSWNYEAGTHLNLFGNTVQADFSVYYMKIRNQQLSVMAGNYGFGRMMINAGRSHSCGVETSIRGKAMDNNLSWGITYSFTNSRFDNYKDESNGNISDYKGKHTPYIPVQTASGAVDYTIPLRKRNFKSVAFGINATFHGKTYWDEANSYSQKPYCLLGGHADMNFEKVTVSLWSRNATSTKYNSFALKSAATGKEIYLAQRGIPFQCGIDLNINL